MNKERALTDKLMLIPAYEPKVIHPLFPRFCPCQDCPYYQEPDNPITKSGTYPVKCGERRQRLYCHWGEHRLSDEIWSELTEKEE